MRYNHFFFSIEADGYIFTSNTCEITNGKFYAEYRDFDFLLTQKVNKITIVAEQHNFPVAEIQPLMPPEIKLLITENGKYVQLMPDHVSKLSAIENICKD